MLPTEMTLTEDSLLPPFVWLHVTLGIVGVLIMIYTFSQRVLKEDLCVSEVLAATFTGVILGPALFNVLDPTSLTASDDVWFQVFQQIMRIVLAVQLVSAAMGLPILYVEKQWKSMAILLGPCLLCSWAISFGFAVWIFPQFSLLQCLTIAACLTPTDPVLASSVLQGKFAMDRIPAPIRHLLQAESGANDGIALPLVLLPTLLIQSIHTGEGTGEVLWKWIYEVWLYQVGLAVVVGLAYGLLSRYVQHLSEVHDTQDEPSFLAHIIGLALGAVGLVRGMGSDGVLAVFVSGIAFSSREPTLEDGRYDAINGIELILSITFFVIFGSILPFHTWPAIGVGRLFLFSFCVILLKRVPAVLAFCRFIPELQRTKGTTLAHAAFAGWFGPIGVGSLFYSTFVQEEIGEQTSYQVVSFVVLCSLIVHGVSAAPLTRLLSSYLAKKEKASISDESASLTYEEAPEPQIV